jgi:nickel-type superoxide dismutase maturation protease
MRKKGGRSGPLLVLAGALAAVGGAIASAAWLDVVEVRGRSMEPALLPGDRLLVERWTYARRAPRPDEVVLAADPRDPRRELVKRVASVLGGEVRIAGDNAAASSDSATFGALPLRAVRWRAVALCWPARRIGRIVRG